MLSFLLLTRISYFGAILYWISLKFAKAAEVSFLTAEDFRRARIKNFPNDADTTFLTDEDFKRGQLLTLNELATGNKRQLYQKDKFHGDIVGKASWKLQTKNGIRRNGVRLTYDKWPSGIIPYALSTRYSPRERAILARAIQAYHDKTCIKFVPKRGDERDYLYIGKIDGCFSDVGRAGGRQEVSLDDGCIEYDTAIHELMHAVGFWHEHERWDRDDFIDILWQNIDRDAYDQFGRVNLFESNYYDEKYDYYSIMHYDRKSFSKNGGDTMVSRKPGMSRVIGKVKDFSTIDLRKINKMYSCKNSVNTQPPFSVSPPAPPPSSWQSWQPVQPVVQSTPVSNSNNQNCRDKATLCWRWVNRCRSPFFEQIMREFCASTCGFCYSGGVNGNSIPLRRFGRKRK